MSESSPQAAIEPAVPRPVGGGESLLWTGAYALSQLVAVCLTLAVVALLALGPKSLSTDSLLQLFLDLEIDRSFLVFGVSTLGAALMLIPLVRWRLGATWRTQLQMELPNRWQTLLVVGSVFPLAILSDELYRVCLAWWGQGSSDTNQVVQSLSFQVSYPILVVAVALGPAVGEELVFRGLIGQGLVQRWGRAGGIMATAALFGLAHLSPAHAIATLPLGIFLHWVYLQTRSLWAAILLHFLNNLLVITMAHFRLGGLPASPVLIATAFGCLTAIGWRMGTEASRGEPVVRPLAGPFWRAWQQVYEGWSLLAYTAAFVWSAGIR